MTDAAHDNEAGWALLQKPGRTTADRETAVACFRRAIAAEQPQAQAVGNLANALVELGRDADAIAELEAIAAGDDMLASNAHNWLGWRKTVTEPARALVHLREATRLRPRWGVAWQNLARLLDATGDIAGACRAYGEAITCGDAHDDAFARDRRLQLEMMLLGAGEQVPPVPAEAHADSLAFGIVRATAARLPAPRAFAIRPTTRDTPWAMIGTVDGERALGLGIVGADTLTTLTGLDVASLRLDPAREGDDGATVLLERIAAADPAALTPFDAAMYVRDVALAGIGTHWRWELASYRPAGLAVCEVGGPINVAVTARAAGIEISLFPEAIGGTRELLVADAPARLVELAPQIAAATTRAIAARDAFLARAFSIERMCALLAEYLRGLRAPRIVVQYPDWPRAWFDATSDGVTVMWLEESADGYAITIGRDHWTVRAADEVVAVAPALGEALRIDRDRVRIERMAVNDRFRVLEAFRGFAVGAELVFARDSYDPHDGYHSYEFVGGAVRVWLSEYSDDDVRVLAELDRYLARA